MISVNCRCGKAFSTKEANAGKKTKCPTCGAILRIPAVATDDEISDLLVNTSRFQQPAEPTPVPPPAPPMSGTVTSTYGMTDSATSVARSTSGQRDLHRTKRRTTGLLDFDSSVLVGLLDFAFARFITPSIIRSLYVSHVFIILLCVAGLVWSNYVMLADSASRNAQSPMLRYLFIAVTNIAALIFMFIWTLIVRLCLEAVMVLFRGEEHLRDLVESAQNRQ